MLSSWSGRLLFAGVILGGLCLVSMSLAQDKKPNVIEIDLSKLPPDVAKAVLESLKAKEEIKPITLGEALAIAEKSARSQAIRAEREGEGAETRFKIDLVGKDGAKTRVVLGPTGKPVDSPETAKGPPEGKGPPAGKGLGKAKKQPPPEPKPGEPKN